VRQAAVRELGGEPPPLWGTPYASDVGCLINTGRVEAVTFGPGDIRHAHAPDEHVRLADVSAAARVVEHVAEEVLRG
jgi:acetylornithine deacetylase